VTQRVLSKTDPRTLVSIAESPKTRMPCFCAWEFDSIDATSSKGLPDRAGFWLKSFISVPYPKPGALL